MRKIIIYGIVFMMLLSLVHAIGVRPTKTEFVYDENPIYNGNFMVVNNEDRDLSLKVYVDGDLANYIFLDTNTLEFKEGEEIKYVWFKLNLPDNILKGNFASDIVVEEISSDYSGDGISSKIRLRHHVIVKGEFPEKYLETKINFQDNGDKLRIVSEVENKGKLDLGNVQTIFNIPELNEELESEVVTLKTDENKILYVDLDKTNLKNGEYEVSAVTKYDNMEMETSKIMTLGRPEVEVSYFDRYFVSNDINKYNLELQNNWNKKVENVYVDVIVKDGNMQIDTFRTRSTNIDALGIARIIDYFNAQRMDSGRYAFEMVVNFWNIYKMDKKVFAVDLLDKQSYEQKLQEEDEFLSLRNTNPGIIESVATEKHTDSYNPWMIAFFSFIGLGVLAIILMWLYFNRRSYEEF